MKIKQQQIKPLGVLSVCGLVSRLLLVGCLLLSGCAAKTLLRLEDKAKLADYDFTTADKFGVLVTLPTDKFKTMHQAVPPVLGQQLATMLNEELGVTGVVVDAATYQDWAAAERQRALAPAGEPAVVVDPARYFRQAGYRGFLLVTATETLDSAARNDLDYSLSTRFELRALETTDKGDIAPVFAQFTTAKAVCSRRFRDPLAGGPARQALGGYRLTNVDRCAATVVYRARLKLAEYK